jgi:glycosyltransferase involved in cell wall biosynthesis
MSISKYAVVMSTYNGGDYLGTQLDSIFCHDIFDIHLYVRDDCSQDKTKDILQKYSQKYNITILESSKRLGAAQSFMNVLSSVPNSYSYYFFADQDDFWISHKIERSLNFLSQYSDIPALYCSRLELVDRNLNHLGYSKIPKILGFENALVECVATGCGVAFNLAAKKLLSRCSPDKIFMHDWWAYLVISAFGEIVYDEQPSVKYRQHGANVVGSAYGELELYIRRIKRLVRGNADGIFQMSSQAEEFLKCYGEELDSSKKEILTIIVEGKNSFLKRINLAFSKGFQRQSNIDDILLRFLILFNLY